MLSHPIGLTGSLLLAFCALPQVLQCFKTKTAKGVNLPFLLMWLGGEICTMLYVYEQHGLEVILFINYVLNVLFIGSILYYKYKDFRSGK